MEYQLGLLKRAELRREASQARLKAEKLNMLHNIGTVVASSWSVENVLTRVVEAAVFITNAEEGSLLLLDEGTQELYLRAQKGLGEKYARGFRIRVEDSIAGEVVRVGRCQRLASMDGDLKVVTGYMVNAIIYVPVVSRGEVIGVLSVDNQLNDGSFAEDDENFLTILAGYAAIALENAKLLEELDRKAEIAGEAFDLGHPISRLPVDLDDVGIVMYQDSGFWPPKSLLPNHIETVINPYLNALAEIQHIVDEINGRPPNRVSILSITHDSPTVATIEGVRQAVEGIKETVAPCKREIGQFMAQLAVKEKDVAIETTRAEILEVRAWAAQSKNTRERLLAEALERHAEAERLHRQGEQLRLELQGAKIQLAHDFVTRIDPDLPVQDTIAYVVRLLPALERIAASPLQVSTIQDRKAEDSLPSTPA